MNIKRILREELEAELSNDNNKDVKEVYQSAVQILVMAGNVIREVATRNKNPESRRMQLKSEEKLLHIAQSLIEASNS